MTDEKKRDRPERFLKMMQLFLKVTKVDSVKGSTFVVMDKSTAQAMLYERYPGFILPDGMLDFSNWSGWRRCFSRPWRRRRKLRTPVYCTYILLMENYVGSAMAGVRLRPTGGKKD